MEQDRKPRDLPPHLWSINLQQRRQDCHGEKTVSLVSGAWKIEQLNVKKEIRTLLNTIHNNKPKMY